MSNTPGALIAMSGGVDSTVAAYLMKQAGGGAAYERKGLRLHGRDHAPVPE